MRELCKWLCCPAMFPHEHGHDMLQEWPSPSLFSVHRGALSARRHAGFCPPVSQGGGTGKAHAKGRTQTIHSGRNGGLARCSGVRYGAPAARRCCSDVCLQQPRALGEEWQGIENASTTGTEFLNRRSIEQSIKQGIDNVVCTYTTRASATVMCK